MKREMVVRAAKRAAGERSHDVEKRIVSRGPLEPASHMVIVACGLSNICCLNNYITPSLEARRIVSAEDTRVTERVIEASS